MLTSPGYVQFIKTVSLLAIFSLASVVFGINIYLQTFILTGSDEDDVVSPVWPFTHVRWNIAVGGLTVSAVPIMVIGECWRRRNAALIAWELFSLIAFSVIWIIAASVNAHQISLYDNYCAYYNSKHYSNDVCGTIIPLSRTTRTLATIEAVVTSVYAVAVLLIYIGLYRAQRARTAPSAGVAAPGRQPPAAEKTF